MANILTAKIDVRKLDKARFFEGKADKDGHRPLYADVVLFPKKEVGSFGDTHYIVQSKKKDENIQMPILGNATERGGAPVHRPPPPAEAQQRNSATPAGDEDVPF